MKLPNGWKRDTIGNVSDISVGRDLVENSFSQTKSDAYRYPIYSNSVTNKGLYGYYNFEEYPSGCVTVVGRGAGLGMAFSRLEGFGAIGRLLVLRPKDNRFDVRFLTDYINQKVVFYNESGGIPQLPGESIAKYTILLPPLPEQKAIADLLSVWDTAIEKTEKLIAAKEQRFRWLLDELITKPSKCGKWREVRLSQICNVVKGQQLNVEHMIESGQYYALNGGIAPSGRTDDWNTPEDTITISEGGNSCGFVSYNTEKFWAGGHCYSLMNV